MEPLAAVGLAAGAALVAVWARTNRSHVRRRHARRDEWDSARPELWTSAARCRDCGAGGGLVEQDGDRVRFTCLRCGATHLRDVRG